MNYTRHPRSRFERRMQRRRERQASRARNWNHLFPSVNRPPGPRAARRINRQGWSYVVVHRLTRGPAATD